MELKMQGTARADKDYCRNIRDNDLSGYWCRFV
jgi:hypothetical protein